MAKIELYYAPGSCAQVPLVALETIGAHYELKLVRFMKGENRTDEYLRLNPAGKVPSLVIDGKPLTENVAILIHLNSLFPEARLLPKPYNNLDFARQLADLSFCTSTLHPIVGRIRLPMLFAVGDEAVKSVYFSAIEAMGPHFETINNRVSSNNWWYGDEWSVIDAYLYWVWFRVTGAGFPVQDFAEFSQHALRMEERPAVQRMLQRDAECEQQLVQEGLSFSLPSISSDS